MYMCVYIRSVYIGTSSQFEMLHYCQKPPHIIEYELEYCKLSEYCILYSVHSTVSTIQYTLPCTMYSVQCIVYNIELDIIL